MRQADFPDQRHSQLGRERTLTHTGQAGRLLGNSATCCSAEQPEDRQDTKGNTPSLHTCSHVHWPSSRHCQVWKAVSSGSEPPPPTQSRHTDDQDLAFFLRATGHPASRGDHDHTLPYCFLTRPRDSAKFPLVNPSPPDKQGDLEDLYCWTRTEREGTCGVRLLKTRAHCVVLGMTSLTPVHPSHSPSFCGLKFSVHFLKW